MAGKAEGVGTVLSTVLGTRMGQRLTRAYAEGRLAATSNPHTVGTPESSVWLTAQSNNGNPLFKFETAVP